MLTDAHDAGMPTPPPTRAAAGWDWARQLGFRFLFSYFFLYLFPPPLPGLSIVGGPWARLCNAITAWVMRAVLHLPDRMPTVDTGSSDTISDWVYVGWTLVAAAGIAVVWSAVARSPQRHERLAELLRIELRYTLAITMLGYAIVKLIDLQFAPPPPLRLLERVGDLSPMALMWTFMGYSRAYVYFAGAAELLGAALLLFRRTTAAGALVVLAVMTHVVVLDLCYDVPVKLLALQLWLMTAWLLVPDAGRLVSVLLLNRPTAPRRLSLELPWPWLRTARVVVKPLVIAAIVATSLTSVRQFKREFLGGTPAAFAGVWDVDDARVIGRGLPPLLQSAGSWRRIDFDLGRMGVDPLDARLNVPPGAAFDEAAHTITLANFPDEHVTVSFVRLDDGRLRLSSGSGDAQLELTLRRHPPGPMLLTSRGFHWISDEAVNR